jgi:serine/threonine protein kinase
MVGEGLRMDAVRQLFGGIDYLHELNIIHRDLKPANILFRGAVLKICDMGQVCQQSLNTLLHLVFCGRLCI